MSSILAPQSQHGVVEGRERRVELQKFVKIRTKYMLTEVFLVQKRIDGVDVGEVGFDISGSYVRQHLPGKHGLAEAYGVVGGGDQGVNDERVEPIDQLAETGGSELAGQGLDAFVGEEGHAVACHALVWDLDGDTFEILCDCENHILATGPENTVDLEIGLFLRQS